MAALPEAPTLPPVLLAAALALALAPALAAAGAPAAAAGAALVGAPAVVNCTGREILPVAPALVIACLHASQTGDGWRRGHRSTMALCKAQG